MAGPSTWKTSFFSSIALLATPLGCLPGETEGVISRTRDAGSIAHSDSGGTSSTPIDASADGGAPLDASPGGDSGAPLDASADGGSRVVPTVWPNEISQANSSPWLVEHHDTLRQLRPRVLVLNFLGPKRKADVLSTIAKVEFALEEASRYHGYLDQTAPAFIDYQVGEVHDLPGPPLRRSPTEFDHTELVSGRAFATRLGITGNGGTPLTVCELFEQGLVNDVWVFEQPDDPGKLFEFRALGQRYNERFEREGVASPCAGNGCMEDTVRCSVTVRLHELNVDRGPGCATHAFGHGMEGLAKAGTIPYYTKNAFRFFNFDLDTRYGAPFPDFYGCAYDSQNCIVYESPTTLRSGQGLPKFEITDFGQGCGNVHFAPHSRYQYDYEEGALDASAGSSSCANYGMGNGADGADLRNLVSYESYRALNLDPRYGDCGGGWQLYLHQSMPGLGNKARDTGNSPMKNWLPFLYY